MPERQVSLQELESKLDSYIHDVENGAALVVSRDGRHVARIIPETGSAERKRAALKASGTFDWSGRRLKSRRPSVRLRDGGGVSDIIHQRAPVMSSCTSGRTWARRPFTDTLLTHADRLAGSPRSVKFAHYRKVIAHSRIRVEHFFSARHARACQAVQQRCVHVEIVELVFDGLA